MPRFCLAAEEAVGDVDCGRADRPRLLLGDGRRRASIRDLQSLGRVPGRCSFNGGIGPAFVSGSYCGSLKPACDGASSDRGGGDGGCGGGFVYCRCCKGKGFRDLSVIFIFVEALSAKFGGTALLCILDVSVFVRSVYVSLTS